MRCQARRGRRRGRGLSQIQIPGPLQRSPSGRGAGNEGDGVGCPNTGYPDRKDVPQRHTDKAPTPSRTSPDGGADKTAGMRTEVANDQGRIPRARVPVGMVHHPAGTSRATGQAMAEHSSEDPAKAGPAPGRTSDGSKDRHDARRRLARETHAAGIDAERGAGRSHINSLDRLLLAPRPRQALMTRREMIPTGGEAWGF